MNEYIKYSQYCAGCLFADQQKNSRCSMNKLSDENNKKIRKTF